MKYAFAILMTGLVVISCGKKADENTEGTTSIDQITLTADQFKANDMALGFPEKITFANEVSCNGYISSPVNGSAKVTSLVPGQIANFKIVHGQYVNKGDVICTIKSTDFINIQKNYADASANYIKAKADYERVSSLRSENIGAEKDLTTAQSNYQMASASLNAMETTINSLGLNTSAIKNGHFYSEYPVIAPISGYISGITSVVGQFADVSTEIVEIIDTKKTELSLSVFEKDIYKIKPGQDVQFQMTDNSENLNAKIEVIGKTVDPESKTIECIAHIDHTGDVSLVNASYVKANIITDTTSLLALPNTAFVKSEGSVYIYVLKKENKNEYLFEKKLVHITTSNDTYSAVEETLPDAQILTKGGSTL